MSISVFAAVTVPEMTDGNYAQWKDEIEAIAEGLGVTQHLRENIAVVPAEVQTRVSLLRIKITSSIEKSF